MPLLDSGLPSERTPMTDFTVGQFMPAALHRISTGSGCSPAMSRSATLIGTSDKAASATTVSSYLPSPAKVASAASFISPARCRPSTPPLRGTIVARPDALADFAGDLIQYPLNVGFLPCRRRRQQALALDGGRLGQ